MRNILLIIAIFCTIELNAQTCENYYKNTDKIYGKSYTYSVSINKYSGYIEVQNERNIKSKQPWYYKGSTEYADSRWATYATLKDKEEIYKLIAQVFTKDEIDILNEEISKYLTPTSRFNIQNIITSSGKIEEVIISFHNSCPYTSIHPDKLYELEQKIKERLQYSVPDILKRRFEYIRTESIRIDFNLLR